MDREQKEEALSSLSFKIASLAVLTALTAVFTYAVRIPVAPTRGYLNLGDVAVYFSAFAFGPVTALVSGGLGTALADLLSGYAQWAPISLVIHGLQGLAAGLILRAFQRKRGGSKTSSLSGWILAGLSGTVIMAGLYLLAGSFMVGFGAAVVELPGNLLQNGAGLLIGIPVTLAVAKAYPPLAMYRW